MSNPDHLLISFGLTESLRSLIRHHLADSPNGTETLQELAGQVLAVRLEPFGKTLFFCPTSTDIQIFTAMSGKPDVTVSGNLAAFAKASLLRGKSADERLGDLTITGNPDTAQHFLMLAEALRIDWSKLFRKHLGSGFADSLLTLLSRGGVWSQETVTAFHDDVSEYLREEVRWLPDSSQTHDFSSQVNSLVAGLDRLNVRITGIESAIDAPRLSSSSNIEPHS